MPRFPLPQRRVSYSVRRAAAKSVECAAMSPQAESIATMEVSLSFDDVLLLPGRSSVLPTDCDVTTTLSRLALRIPMMSSAMDTVTEAQTAIAMALMGGIGVLHRNCSPEEQAKVCSTSWPTAQTKPDYSRDRVPDGETS